MNNKVCLMEEDNEVFIFVKEYELSNNGQSLVSGNSNSVYLFLQVLCYYLENEELF